MKFYDIYYQLLDHYEFSVYKMFSNIIFIEGLYYWFISGCDSHSWLVLHVKYQIILWYTLNVVHPQQWIRHRYVSYETIILVTNQEQRYMFLFNSNWFFWNIHVHFSAEIDNCHSEPCMNGGSCEDRVQSYSCQGPVGYTGLLCETG